MQAERANMHRWILSSLEETRSAAAAIAAAARHSLVILTPDLEPGVYDHPDFLEATKRLVLARRYAQIQVLISDPGRALLNSNRFVAMARRLNSCIKLRNLHEDHRGCEAAFLIADDSALLYRANAARWNGIADSSDPAVAQRYLKLFNTLWDLSGEAGELKTVAH